MKGVKEIIPKNVKGKDWKVDNWISRETLCLGNLTNEKINNREVKEKGKEDMQLKSREESFKEGGKIWTLEHQWRLISHLLNYLLELEVPNERAWCTGVSKIDQRAEGGKIFTMENDWQYKEIGRGIEIEPLKE